jgi:hypothetical protein
LAVSSVDHGVNESNPTKRGRKAALVEQIDSKVQFFLFFFFFINSVQDSGGVLNFSIVRAGAKLIVLLHDRSLLFANEGYTELMG